MISKQQHQIIIDTLKADGSIREAANAAGVSYDCARYYGHKQGYFPRRHSSGLTNEQKAELQALFEHSIGVRTAAKMVGTTYAAAKQYAAENDYKGGTRGRRPPTHLYASQRAQFEVYSVKDNTLLAKGTALECAQQLGLTLKSFYSIHNLCEHGKRNTYIFKQIRKGNES